jgi:hypothetical protein
MLTTRLSIGWLYSRSMHPNVALPSVTRHQFGVLDVDVLTCTLARGNSRSCSQKDVHLTSLHCLTTTTLELSLCKVRENASACVLQAVSTRPEKSTAVAEAPTRSEIGVDQCLSLAVVVTTRTLPTGAIEHPVCGRSGRWFRGLNNRHLGREEKACRLRPTL